MTVWWSASSPYINRFLSADTVVPNPSDPQDLNRFSYVRNNPVRYVDPTGHDVQCSLDGGCYETCDYICTTPSASNNPPPTIPAPSKRCKSDCYDAYETYTEVVSQMGYVPSPEEILYMTADSEYAAYADDRGVRELGQEGLARSFYEEDGGCGRDGTCEGDELYEFLAGYQPWIGWAGQQPNEPTTPFSRSQKLVTTLGSNKEWLVTDVLQILDGRGPGDYAYDRGWIDGLWTGRPSQWFGPFTPDRDCRKNATPLKRVDTGNGTEFWILPPEEIMDYNAFCK